MNNQQTIIEQVFKHASENPNKPAIIFEDSIVSYQHLKQHIIEVANSFLEDGIKKGNKIILSASYSPSFIYGYLATHLISGIAVPIDPKLPELKIDYIIKKISPKKIFLSAQIDILNRIKCKNYRQINFPKMDQTADILFTSGTTGEPKGVILSQKNILAAATNINLFIGNGQQDIEVIPLPLSHSFGLGRLRCNLLAGSTVILCSGFLNPLKILELMKKYKATGFSSVPAGIAILLRLTKDKLSQLKNALKYIEIGSAPMSMEDKKTLMSLLPHTRICMHYGLTEASRSLFINFHRDFKKINSIGKPSPNVSVKIADESGRKLPPGEVGIIMIKAKTIMQKYLDDKRLTEKVFKKNWFITEDLGYFDTEGYYYLIGRKSEVINVGGEKVYPSEVESVLDKFKDINESACIGINDPRGISGQVVKAFLVSKSKKRSSISKIINFLRKYLEEYKIPKEFEWVFEIPKTSSGKIQRGLLK